MFTGASDRARCVDFRVSVSLLLHRNFSFLTEPSFWCTIILSLVRVVGNYTQPSAENKRLKVGEPLLETQTHFVLDINNHTLSPCDFWVQASFTLYFFTLSRSHRYNVRECSGENNALKIVPAQQGCGDLTSGTVLLVKDK